MDNQPGYCSATHKKLFFILLSLEGVILVLSIIGQQIMNGFMLFLFKLIVLIAANCCQQSSFAALYSVFALLGALYSFSPVGLFITGHGDLKTTPQNICCVFIVILSIVGSYLGYHYTRALQGEEVQFIDNGNGPSNSFGGNAGYGGNNGGYGGYGGLGGMGMGGGGMGGGGNQPQERTFQYQAGTNTRQSQNRRQFKAFSGQGYSLG